jgi:hypothetical protein
MPLQMTTRAFTNDAVFRAFTEQVLLPELRRRAARTLEALEAAIGEATETVTVSDARGWFQHCGYVFAPD